MDSLPQIGSSIWELDASEDEDDEVVGSSQATDVTQEVVQHNIMSQELPGDTQCSRIANADSESPDHRGADQDLVHYPATPTKHPSQTFPPGEAGTQNDSRMS